MTRRSLTTPGRSRSSAASSRLANGTPVPRATDGGWHSLLRLWGDALSGASQRHGAGERDRGRRPGDLLCHRPAFSPPGDHAAPTHVAGHSGLATETRAPYCDPVSPYEPPFLPECVKGFFVLDSKKTKPDFLRLISAVVRRWLSVGIDRRANFW